ncbi:MAG: SET domain-containing protein [Methyloceanibacter sp.]
MLLINTYVAQSPIAGLGVFAAEPVARGQLIWTLNQKFTLFIQESDVVDFPPHMQQFLAHYGYPHMEMPGVIVLDSDNGRFMNHSVSPNTDFRIFDRGYALADIAAGEELTCNYHEIDPAFTGLFPETYAAINGRAPGNGTPATP